MMSEDARHRWFWVYLVLAAVVVGWIGVRTQITADRQEAEAARAVAFADQTHQCLQDVVANLRARAAITDNADRLNSEQHRVISEMIAAVATAPLDRKQEVLDQYLPHIVEAQQRQEALIEDRAARPLPDPPCPKG